MADENSLSPEARAIRELQKMTRVFEYLLVKSPTRAQLDIAAGKIIQAATTLRGLLRNGVVHYRTVCEEMGYDGPACLSGDGEITTKPCQVTCPECRKELEKPVERRE